MSPSDDQTPEQGAVIRGPGEDFRKLDDDINTPLESFPTSTRAPRKARGQ